MEYCTFYWESTVIPPQTEPPAPGAIASKIIAADALYQKIGKEDRTIWLREVMFWAVQTDDSSNLVRPCDSIDLALLENDNTIVASRNLNMTVLAGQDENAPGGAFLYVAKHRLWKGKIKLPPSFELCPTGGQSTALAVPDYRSYYCHIGYELE